jgi:hypothetical protein
LKSRLHLIAGMLALPFAITACGPVEDPTLFPEYKPSAADVPPPKAAVAYADNRNLLWGDLHIHTSYSTDAYTMGVRATPDDAYLFTRGGTISHGAGYPIRINKPLDFAAVTDHSEYLGVLRQANLGLPLEVKSIRDRLLEDGPLSFTIAQGMSAGRIAGGDLTAEGIDDPSAMMTTAWQEIRQIAQRHYEPGVFTTFVAYEWTSMPGQQNLHRNVIYRGLDVPELPFSSLDSENPEDLWDELDRQRESGIQVFAIPHNGNVSNGLMYRDTTFNGGEINNEYAEQRMRNEPVSEILQIKGTSDTHPLLSPEDEFANFEIVTQQLSASGDFSEPKGSYARDALRTGLEFNHSEGFNPYKFGVIGSSDSHNASTSVEEGRHHGKLPVMDGTAAIRLGLMTVAPESYQRQRRWGSAGLAAVWAQENTRESIFDAMRRKETYATSGPRIKLRFFGGWAFEADMMDSTDALDMAYDLGVPMGGNLLRNTDAGAPRFMVWAAKDPEGANLDRIQIVKGWVDENSVSHEQVFDVAASDGRRLNTEGRYPALGSTVDVADASYNNSIGEGQLSVMWQDPSFDAEQGAFYYARVLEIPTPRWSTYDAKTLAVEPPDPVSLQERAISSSIWYQP